MQKVKYTNPKGEEVAFGFSPPYIFEKIAGIGAEDAQLITTESAGNSGKTFHGLYFGDREITLTMHIKGTTRAAMYENRQKLIAKLNPEQSASGKMGRLEYSNDYMTVWIPCIVKSAPQSFQRYGNYEKSVQIVFYCPSHLFRATNPQRNRIAYMGGGLEFPAEFGAVEFGAQGYQTTLFNSGDSAAPVMVQIYGPAVMPQIMNWDTGEYIKVNRELYAGDLLTIGTEPNNLTATILRANGTTEIAFGYIDLSSTFFQAAPGENKLRYLSEDDSTSTVVIIEMYPRYGGV